MYLSRPSTMGKDWDFGGSSLSNLALQYTQMNTCEQKSIERCSAVSVCPSLLLEQNPIVDASDTVTPKLPPMFNFSDIGHYTAPAFINNAYGRIDPSDPSLASLQQGAACLCLLDELSKGIGSECHPYREHISGTSGACNKESSPDDVNMPQGMWDKLFTWCGASPKQIRLWSSYDQVHPVHAFGDSGWPSTGKWSQGWLSNMGGGAINFSLSADLNSYDMMTNQPTDGMAASQTCGADQFMLETCSNQCPEMNHYYGTGTTYDPMAITDLDNGTIMGFFPSSKACECIRREYMRGRDSMCHYSKVTACKSAAAYVPHSDPAQWNFASPWPMPFDVAQSQWGSFGAFCGLSKDQVFSFVDNDLLSIDGIVSIQSASACDTTIGADQAFNITKLSPASGANAYTINSAERMLEIKMEEKGTQWVPQTSHELKCTQTWLDMVEVDSAETGPMTAEHYRNMTSTSVANAAKPDYGVRDITMTRFRVPSVDSTCTQSWKMAMNLSHFLEYPAYNETMASIVTNQAHSLNSSKVYSGFYIRCKIQGNVEGTSHINDNVQVDWHEEDYVIVLGYDENFMTSDVEDIDGSYLNVTVDAVASGANALPADAEYTRINVTDLYELTADLAEGESDGIVRIGESVNVTLDLNNTLLPKLHYLRLNELSIECKYYNSTSAAKDPYFYHYYDRSVGDLDPGPLCISNIDEAEDQHIGAQRGHFSYPLFPAPPDVRYTPFVTFIPEACYEGAAQQRLLHPSAGGSIDVIFKVNVTLSQNDISHTDTGHINYHPSYAQDTSFTPPPRRRRRADSDSDNSVIYEDTSAIKEFRFSLDLPGPSESDGSDSSNSDGISGDGVRTAVSAGAMAAGAVALVFAAY